MTHRHDSIVVLNGLEAVRLRPGMYLGEVEDPRAKSFLIPQLLATAAIRAVHERTRRIQARVRVDADGVVQIDDDVGLPIEAHEGRWSPELQFTQLHGHGARGSTTGRAFLEQLL